MKTFCLALAALIVALSVTAPSATADSMSYLDNGVIRLGVDLAKGGTITYLATSGAGENVLNSFDLGREVQQSYYSGPDNFGNPAPPWTNFPWNANAAGDTYGNPSTVLEQTNDGSTIYTKTIPLQWALNGVVCECVIEQWITLNGNTVQVHNRFTNNRSDHTQYQAYGQGLPAAYTNGSFWRLLTYNGPAPYTDAPLTQLPLAPPPGQYWWRFAATEHWAALVNDAGFGLGVFNPTITPIEGGFVGTPDVGGPSDDPTGQIAPTPIEIIDWNIVFEYDYVLVLGTLDEIRAYAVAHRPDDRPDYHFANDRQHFFLVNATDAGWPVSGAWRVNIDQNDPYVLGPEQWWQASEVPYLYITAAYHTSGTHAQVFWSIPGAGTVQERSVRFEAIPDGQYHTYVVNLAASPSYQGTISGIRFDPSEGNDPGGYVDIAAITWKSPDLPADLAVMMTHSPDPAPMDESLSYTVTVTNHGPGPATGVTVSDSLLAGLTFVSATPSEGNCSGPSTIVCHLGALNSGGAVTVTVTVTPTQMGSVSNTASVTANESDPNLNNNSATEAATVTWPRLTALGPVKLWIGGNRNLRLDLQAEVQLNGITVGSGQLANVKAGGVGFNTTSLDTVALALGAATPVPSGAILSLRVSARLSCPGTPKSPTAGTARLWYNGQPIDTGRRTADAGSRFAATIGGVNNTYFLRAPLGLATIAGNAKQPVDVAVGAWSPCPARPFTVFGTWSVTLP